MVSRNCNIYGFNGENTLLSCEGGFAYIHTDMPHINVNQKDNVVYLGIASLDSTFRTHNVRLKVDAENSLFRLNDRISNHIDVNIQLQESDVPELMINSESTVGTLSLKGTLHKENKYYNGRMNIKHCGVCDSLLIQLTCAPGIAKQLFLSKELSGRYEYIDCSENVIIVRNE